MVDTISPLALVDSYQNWYDAIVSTISVYSPYGDLSVEEYGTMCNVLILTDHDTVYHNRGPSLP
jgi:hypothetical protein